MGIYYLQFEMHFEWKDVKKHTKIDIYKQDFGWLTYTHKNIYVDLEVQQAIFLFHPKSLYLSKKVHEHLDYLFW